MKIPVAKAPVDRFGLMGAQILPDKFQLILPQKLLIRQVEKTTVLHRRKASLRLMKIRQRPAVFIQIIHRLHPAVFAHNGGQPLSGLCEGDNKRPVPFIIIQNLRTQAVVEGLDGLDFVAKVRSLLSCHLDISLHLLPVVDSGHLKNIVSRVRIAQNLPNGKPAQRQLVQVHAVSPSLWMLHPVFLPFPFSSDSMIPHRRAILQDR